MPDSPASSSTSTYAAPFQPATRALATTLALSAFWLLSTRFPVIDFFRGSALASALFMLLVLSPRVTDLIAIAALTPCAAMLRFWSQSGHWRAPANYYATAAGVLAVMVSIGFATLLVAAVRLIWTSKREDRSAALDVIAATAILVVGLIFKQYSLDFASHWQPRVLDLYTLSFDGSLGFQPSFAIGRLLDRHGWLKIAVWISYMGIVIAMALAHAVQVRREGRGGRRFELLLGFLAIAVVGNAIYHLFPATGPIYAFPGFFPDHPPPASVMARVRLAGFWLDPQFSRNAVPSLHFSWALFMWWNLRRYGKWLEAATLVFVALTFLGTLGLGEHYLVDLVIALPFTLMMQGMMMRGLPLTSRPRQASLIFGAGCTGAWLVLLRYGLKLAWMSPWVPWLAIAVTVAASFYFLGTLLMAQKYHRELQPTT